MNWKMTSCFLIALAVALGAFGAHALKAKLDTYHMDVFNKASLYHFLMAIGLLYFSESQNVSGKYLLLSGIIIFSGSLYILAITGIKTFGAITPIGGLLLIAAWIRLGIK